MCVCIYIYIYIYIYIQYILHIYNKIISRDNSHEKDIFTVF